jgi:hypothetical protein
MEAMAFFGKTNKIFLGDAEDVSFGDTPSP